MAEMLKEYESQIASFTLIPSDGGRFELQVNGKLLYSKLETRRHVEPGELTGLIRSFLKEIE